MLKKILVLLAMLYAAACFAAVDVNKASAADLDGVKGIGPVMSKRIVDERKKGDFKSWDDLISRVKGIGDATAAKFSSQGVTVKGEEYKKAAATKKDEAKKEAKADKKDEKAAPAKDAKKDDKSTAAAKAGAATKK